MLLISYISIALKSFPKVDPFVTENLPPSTKKEGACLFPGKWWACQFPGRAVDRPEHPTATGITLACSLCPKAAALLELPARVPERAAGWGLLRATRCNAELVGCKLVLCSRSACCGFVFWAARHLTTPTRDGTHAPAEEVWSFNHWTAREVLDHCEFRDNQGSEVDGDIQRFPLVHLSTILFADCHTLARERPITPYLLNPPQRKIETE